MGLAAFANPDKSKAIGSKIARRKRLSLCFLVSIFYLLCYTLWNFTILKMSLKIGNIDVSHTNITRPEAPDSFYDGFGPATKTLPRGHKRLERSRQFSVQTIYDRDIEILMRDGVVLRADVFRPADGKERVPAILAWSPYGKSGTGSDNRCPAQMLEMSSYINYRIGSAGDDTGAYWHSFSLAL
jgi:hypothetical protein